MSTPVQDAPTRYEGGGVPHYGRPRWPRFWYAASMLSMVVAVTVIGIRTNDLMVCIGGALLALTAFLWSLRAREYYQAADGFWSAWKAAERRLTYAPYTALRQQFEHLINAYRPEDDHDEDQPEVEGVLPREPKE